MRRLFFLTVILTAGAFIQPAQAQDAEVVINWNRLLQNTVFTPGQQPPTVGAQRSYAMMHVAIFDAVNAIRGTYNPYAVEAKASSGASQRAAAVRAAHDVLAALYPSQQSIYDDALAADLAGIPPGRALHGELIGAVVAEQILAMRVNDGWETVPPTYMLPPIPGNWQATPPGFAAATFTHSASVMPFVTSSGTQFLPPPPPLLTSQRYATDFNETKTIGSSDSLARSADQTLIARLFASVGTRTGSLNVWNNVARDAAIASGLDLLDTARLFALLNVTFHDALQTSFVSKFTYGLWRPVTAIRRADEDGNPLTVADLTWTPLLNTPPYPTYAGNAACLSAASAQVLARFFGTDAIAFTVSWEGTPGWTRSYAGFRQLADEHARSRIFGGIHFAFDTEASQDVCTELADYVFDRTMTSR